MRYARPNSTEEYLKLHAGKIGASTLASFSKGMKPERLMKIAESIVKSSDLWLPKEDYDRHTWDGRGWGKEHEDDARRFAGLIMGLDVIDPPLWCNHPSYDFVGCSPDGLVMVGDEERGMEIKCPLNDSLNSLARIGGLKLVFEQRPGWWAQCQASMWVTGETIWHFVLYDPRWQRYGKVVGDCHVWIVPRDEGHMQMLDVEVARLAELLLLVLEARKNK